MVEESITKFFLNTCKLHPQPSQHAVHATVSEVWVAENMLQNKSNAEFIPLTTGSVAEFYIEPMLPHVNDLDVMFSFSTELAVPAGQPPPVNLPEEFHRVVEVTEIIDSHLPGYVYLKLQYLLTKRGDDGKYSAVESDSRLGTYLKNKFVVGDDIEIHGPSLLFTPKRMRSPLPMDAVRCVRCPSWPPQVADWPTRHRNCGWPDSATVARVIGNGCDVVGVSHRQCRHDKRVSAIQWRLSFSRAEIVLLNSWTPLQQIVYPMLRVFVKTERLTDDTGKSGLQRLSNYHIKTLVLWACELKPIYWWTRDSSLIRLCVELLHNLAAWLNDVRVRHYFINNCNLVDNSFDIETIAGQLMSLNRASLSAWFLNKYIRKCCQICSNNVLLLFDDASADSASTKLHTAVSVLIKRRMDTALYDLYVRLLTAEINISHNLATLLSSVRSCACAMNKLAKIDERLTFYFTAVTFLHVSQKIYQQQTTSIAS